jgi:hypothetical protein
VLSLIGNHPTRRLLRYMAFCNAAVQAKRRVSFKLWQHMARYRLVGGGLPAGWVGGWVGGTFAVFVSQP